MSVNNVFIGNIGALVNSISDINLMEVVLI